MSEHPSKLTFSIEESVWLNKGQEIESIFGMSLEPEIMIEERDKLVFIKGGLRLIGKYQSIEEDEGEEDASNEGQFSFRQVGEVTKGEDGESEITHFLPVDITIPTNRIRNLDEVYVQVESFDYDLPERSCIQLTADISISGMTEPQEEIKEKEETEREPLLAATQTAFSFEAKKKVDKEERTEESEEKVLKEESSLPVSNLEAIQEQKNDEFERLDKVKETESERDEKETIAHLSGLAETDQVKAPPESTASGEGETKETLIETESRKQGTLETEKREIEQFEEMVSVQEEKEIPLEEEIKETSREINLEQDEEETTSLEPTSSCERENDEEVSEQEDSAELLTMIEAESEEEVTQPIEERETKKLEETVPIQEEKEKTQAVISIRKEEEKTTSIEIPSVVEEINEQLEETSEDHEKLEVESIERVVQEKQEETVAMNQENEPKNISESMEEINDQEISVQEISLETREEAVQAEETRPLEEMPEQTKINLAPLNENHNDKIEAEEEKNEEQSSFTHREENALYLTKMMSKEEEQFTTWKMCIIQENESLEMIANRYEVSTSQLVRLNRLQQEHVEEGQILYIPVAAESK